MRVPDYQNAMAGDGDVFVADRREDVRGGPASLP